MAATVPVGITMAYGVYVLSPQFDERLDHFIKVEQEIHGCIRRTTRGISY